MEYFSLHFNSFLSGKKKNQMAMSKNGRQIILHETMKVIPKRAKITEMIAQTNHLSYINGTVDDKTSAHYIYIVIPTETIGKDCNKKNKKLNFSAYFPPLSWRTSRGS